MTLCFINWCMLSSYLSSNLVAFSILHIDTHTQTCILWCCSHTAVISFQVLCNFWRINIHFMNESRVKSLKLVILYIVCLVIAFCCMEGALNTSGRQLSRNKEAETASEKWHYMNFLNQERFSEAITYTQGQSEAERAFTFFWSAASGLFKSHAFTFSVSHYVLYIPHADQAAIKLSLHALNLCEFEFFSSHRETLQLQVKWQR